MRTLNFELKELAGKASADLSGGSLRDRRYMLDLIATTLERDLGFRGLVARNLRLRHVHALVGFWQARELATGTIKNRLAQLRWWAEAIGKAGMIPPDNEVLGVERRVIVTNESKVRVLDQGRLDRIRDPGVRWSLRLQEAFGLRREEAIKFQVTYADQGDRIRLKATWCKGGRARQVPVTSEGQRVVLDGLRRAMGKGSLIPPGMSYADQRRVYEGECERVGFDRMHGLRHGYAQRRYEELTGWPCPACGGPKRRELRGGARRIDREVRAEISRELGHGRIEVVAVYCGA